MAYSLSPGVTWSEIDLTTIVPSVSTSVGAFAGDFNWGPVGEIFTISNELDLVRYFGKPDSNTYTSFFTCANFLSYAQNLKVVRAANTTALNATTGTLGVLINNEDKYDALFSDVDTANTSGMFAARYPGDLGNGLRISVWASANTTAYASWEYANEFQGAPSTSNYVATKGGANDEMHIIVVDPYGKFSGVANTVLEKYAFVSKASDAKNDDGSSNYYADVLAQRSEYVWPINHALNSTTLVVETSTWGDLAQGTTFAQTSNFYTMNFREGSRGGAVQPSDVIIAYDKFYSPEDVDISLVMTGSATQQVSEYIVDNIVGYRKDSVAFISPLMNDVVNNAGYEAADIIAYRNDFNNPSSYAVMDSGWKKQFDKYNNVYRWVPLNGDIAGLCARTDFERDAWFSPAGFNRGNIKNVVKLSWNPNKTYRDELYKNGINPVVEFKGEGVILYGDKTMLAKPSAFDRINVRRLFIVLEKAISKAAKYSLFEFNDEFTRAQFVALVEPFLRDVKGRRGIFDFKVVCDDSNNTPEVIDRNEFIGDIYIKPARSINFIQLNFVAVRTGVAFSEVVGKF
jgi:phage tail sheath protein FI